MRFTQFGGLTGLVLGVALMVSAPAASASTRCGSVNDSGTKAPVYAGKLSCSRARSVARYFLRTNRAPSGWRVGNLAGCEWQLAPKGQSLYRWRVMVVRYRGCTD